MGPGEPGGSGGRERVSDDASSGGKEAGINALERITGIDLDGDGDTLRFFMFFLTPI